MLKVSFIHNRKKQLNTKGEAVIQMRLYQNRNIKYFSTGIYIKPSEWDSKRQRVKSGFFSQDYNKQLAELERLAFEAYFDLKEDATLQRIISVLRGGDKNEFEFIGFVQNEIDQNNTLEKSTLSQHLLLVGYLKRYSTRLPFKNITYQYLLNFKAYLQNQISERKTHLHPNYIALLFRIFRGYVTESIKRGYMKTDPFKSFKIKTIETEKVYLEPHELRLFENVSIKGEFPNEQVSKDVFLFCCYTGLRISDAEGLKVKHIVFSDEGLRLVKVLKKTKKKNRVVNLPIFLLFDGKPEIILKKYLISDNLEYRIFPGMNRKTYNDWIDKLRKRAGIEKYFTSHSARHTFGMEMIQRFPIEVVARMMGHGSVLTTQVYARIKTSTIDNLLRGESDEK